MEKVLQACAKFFVKAMAPAQAPAGLSITGALPTLPGGMPVAPLPASMGGSLASGAPLPAAEKPMSESQAAGEACTIHPPLIALTDVRPSPRAAAAMMAEIEAARKAGATGAPPSGLIIPGREGASGGGGAAAAVSRQSKPKGPPASGNTTPGGLIIPGGR